MNIFYLKNIFYEHINHLYLYTCSWFSWTFTNIKQVVLHVQ